MSDSLTDEWPDALQRTLGELLAAENLTVSVEVRDRLELGVKGDGPVGWLERASMNWCVLVPMAAAACA